MSQKEFISREAEARIGLDQQAGGTAKELLGVASDCVNGNCSHRERKAVHV